MTAAINLYAVPAKGSDDTERKAVQATRADLWRRFKRVFNVSSRTQKVRVTVEKLEGKTKWSEPEAVTDTVGAIFDRLVDDEGTWYVKRGKNGPDVTIHTVGLPIATVAPDLSKRPERKKQTRAQQATGDILRLATAALNPAIGAFKRAKV